MHHDRGLLHNPHTKVVATLPACGTDEFCIPVCISYQASEYSVRSMLHRVELILQSRKWLGVELVDRIRVAALPEPTTAETAVP